MPASFVSVKESVPRQHKKPQIGGGGRGPVDRSDYGGGGGRGDGAPDYGERLRRYRLGLALGLTAIVVLFVCMTGAFVVRQGLGTWDAVTGAFIRDWQPLQLPLRLLIINTMLLVTSTFTIELARRQAAQHVLLAPLAEIPGIDIGTRRAVPWLAISGVLGALFIGGQLWAWRLLDRRGVDMFAGPSSSFFYVLTGSHAVHLLAGMIALLYAGATTTLLSKPPETRRIAIDITAWYWHVMTVLWIYIFALLVMAS